MFELKWIWKYMGKKRHLFIIGLILSALTSAMQVINPMLSQKLIDEVITPRKTDLLLPILGAMLVVQVVRLGLRYVMIICLEHNSQQMLDDVRKRMYRVIEEQDYRFYGRIRTGDLMTRITSDLDLVRHFCAWISYNIVDSVVLFSVTIAYLCTVNVPLTLCMAAITPFIAVITYFFSKKIRPMFVELRAKLSNLNTVAQENIAGNRVVKAFAREPEEEEKFRRCNEEFRKKNLEATYVGVKFTPLIELLSQSLTVTSLLVGGIFMMNGSLTAGGLMAFSSLTWALANPLRNLGMLINDVERFFASCRMVIEIFYAQPSIVDHKLATEPKERVKGDVEFKNVSCRIGGTTLLDHVSFHIPAGSTLGIMGTTGSGKTTLVNLIDRIYDVSEGEVLLDGKNVQDYTLHSLRSAVGMATQEVFLFSETVLKNVCYGNPNLSQEEAVKYMKMAAADEFSAKLPDGYETLIGERGVGLSGGQRQRLALARAIAMRPSVLILDDTTSALDTETEKYIQEQLRHLDFPCTKIIVAQKISSVMNADCILVLDRGRIIEKGTHEQLLKHRGYYSSIWALQNGMEQEAVHLGA
jgi:ATP-binding cassette, subfamily B, multidrug efflux pump